MSGAPMKKEDAEQLIGILNTPPPPTSMKKEYAAHISEQVGAAASLGDARIASSVPSLLPLLRSPEDDLRTAAAEALIKIGDRSISSSLITNLSSTDANLRRVSARILGELREPSALTALTTTMAQDTDELVRATAARAIGRIGGTQSLQPLLRAMSLDTSRAVRFSAASALVDIRNRDSNAPVITPLMNAMSDQEPLVRAGVINEVLKIRVLTREERLQIGETAARMAVSDPNSYVRADALPLLFAMASATHDRGLIGRIGDVLERGPDTALRSMAAFNLGQLGERYSAPILITRLSAESEPQVRSQIARSLGIIGGQNALDALNQRLNSPNPARRESDPEVRRNIQHAMDAIMRADPSLRPSPLANAQPMTRQDDPPRQVA